jgi:hypothetical protein
MIMMVVIVHTSHAYTDIHSYQYYHNFCGNSLLKYTVHVAVHITLHYSLTC